MTWVIEKRSGRCHLYFRGDSGAGTVRYTPDDAVGEVNMHLFVEVIGWAGALMILSAYWLLSAGKLGAQTRMYQWMNIVGAAAFIVNSGWNGAYPSAVVNVLWVGIGVWALWRGRPNASNAG